MKKDVNYLDYVPVINQEFKWNVSKDGIVTIDVINKGFFNKIAQTIFSRPKISKIELDTYGSIVWKAIDGTSDISSIADKVRDDFDDNSENSFYTRLAKFFAILEENKFINYKK
ncbi:PqqD family protein [Clostridium sp. BJN0001]|uniref:PqqD family protein n=1 Tax=Clostridium sp. BJN0001 TaxID=2930219 RepID=UPI001FD298DC|nr:PqqD family protein [Clostridium sp. BJN0001]